MEATGHLQIQLRDRCRVLPLRRTDVRAQVRIVDVRRIPGASSFISNTYTPLTFTPYVDSAF